MIRVVPEPSPDGIDAVLYDEDKELGRYCVVGDPEEACEKIRLRFLRARWEEMGLVPQRSPKV